MSRHTDIRVEGGQAPPQDSILLKRIRKSNSAELWIQVVSTDAGPHCADVREYFSPDGGTDWQPSTKGVRLDCDAINVAIEALETMSGVQGTGTYGICCETKTRRVEIGHRVFNKSEYSEIRQFYQKDGAWKPGKGVTFKRESIEEVVDGLENAFGLLCELRPATLFDESSDK